MLYLIHFSSHHLELASLYYTNILFKLLVYRFDIFFKFMSWPTLYFFNRHWMIKQYCKKYLNKGVFNNHRLGNCSQKVWCLKHFDNTIYFSRVLLFICENLEAPKDFKEFYTCVLTKSRYRNYIIEPTCCYWKLYSIVTAKFGERGTGVF